MGGQAEPAGVTQRLSQGSDTVQSSVIFGRRITLCHEMDLLILLRVCGLCMCVCAYIDMIPKHSGSKLKAGLVLHLEMM